MAGQSVGKRLQLLKTRINAACKRSGRVPNSVHLLAVSKRQSLENIRTTIACGQSDFAENYAQEALMKLAQLSNQALRWHFIGRLQSNKIKLLAGHFFAIHSVDRSVLVSLLDRQCAVSNCVQNIFLQFNVAAESSKGGVDRAELTQLLQIVKKSRNLRTLGLMVMPPLNTEPENVRPFFKRARETLFELRASLTADELQHHPLNELSMGTSQDFEIAIEEGATWVRVGTDLFGPRRID